MSFVPESHGVTICPVTPENVLSSIRAQVPPEIAVVLDKRDSAAHLIPMLRAKFDPQDQEHVWDLCGTYHRVTQRRYEELAIYQAMYARMMEIQRDRTTTGASATAARIHKGTPLVRIADAHMLLNQPVLAKRYMMLTICEDAINLAGNIPAENTGSYFRAVWQYGISHNELSKYASDAWKCYNCHPVEGLFPEWLLQELGHEWMTDYPSPEEAALFISNHSYTQYLLDRLGEGDGVALERLAHYLLACVPGFRARMRVRSETTDYDIICAPEGVLYDFRSELGRYFLSECKDWKRRVDVTVVGKFVSVLQSAKCVFGIIFSKSGITAPGQREALKHFQQSNVAVVVFSEADLNQVASGASFFALLRTKYEQVRLDLPQARSPRTSTKQRASACIMTAELPAQYPKTGL